MSELLALTNAAMLSMKTSHDLSQPKAEDASVSIDGIFSPLNGKPSISHADLALSSDSKPPPNTHPIDERLPPSSVGGGTQVVFASKSDVESNPRTSKALLNDSTPSPLTVSAQDINGGSWDFTELASGMDVSSSQQTDGQVLGSIPSRLKLEESVSASRREKEHIVLTPPQSTSSPSGPIRVRMSAKKLREIQSPYSSDQSTLSDSTSTRKEGSNPAPRVVTLSAAGQHPPRSGGIEEKTRPHKQPYYRHLQSKTNKALKQGILYTASHEEDSKANTSDESIVIARSDSDGKHRKLKLLQQKTDDRKEPNHTTPHPVFHIVDFPVASINENHSNNGSSGKAQPLHPAPVPPPGGQQHDDRLDHRLEETVKLVASCTAAATAAAVLASNEGVKKNKKPVRGNTLGNSSWLMDGVEKVPSSPTHSVSDLHRTIKTNTHSSEQETLKNNKACGSNELDVSDNKRQHHKQVSRVTQLNNNKALSYELQRSSTRKEELCITSDHEGQGISYSQQHTHLEHIPFKKRAKMAAQFSTTEGATKKSKRRAIDLESGDSPHSPSLPKHHRPLQPVDHREYELQSYYASRSSEIQMNDVLQRLQKLEEFQHAHAVGAIKGVYQPHPSDHPTSNKSLSEERKPNSHWSKNAEAEPTTGERGFNFTSVSSLPFTMTTMRSHVPLGTHDTNSPITTHHSPDIGNKGGSAHSGRQTSVHMETMPQLHAKPNTPEKGMQKVRAEHDAVPGSHTRILDAASDTALGASNQTLDRYAHSKEHSGESMMHSDEGMDALVQAAKVLSSVKQSRQEMEMQFALEQSEEQMNDLAALMRSLQNRDNPSLVMDSSSVDSADIACKVVEFLSSGQNGDTLPHVKDGGKVSPKHQARPLQRPAANKLVNPTTAGDKRQQPKSQRLQPLKTPDMIYVPRMAAGQPSTATSHHLLSKVASNPPMYQPALHRERVNVLPKAPNTQQPPPPSLAENFSRQPQSLTSAQLTSQYSTGLPIHPLVPHHVPIEGSYPSLMQLQKSVFPPSMAVPLGAPCIMPSPLSTEALPGGTMTESPLIVSPSSLQPSKTKPSEIVSTADVCLQTSADLSSPRSREYLVLSPPKEMAQENEGSVTSETVNVEGLPGFDAALRECADQDASVQEMKEMERQKGDKHSVCGDQEIDGISIEGHHQPIPPPTSPLTHAPDHFIVGGEGGEEDQMMSSEELDQQLREHVEHRALEWVQQELLARMLTQVKAPCDPIKAHCHDNSTINTCSTCSPTPDRQDMALAPLLGSSGMQLFVDAGIPVEDGAVVDLVRDAVKEQISELIKEMTGTSQDKPEQSSAVPDDEPSVDDYTPPESGSVISSSSTSESITPILSTPQPTPRHSPTPSLEHTLVSEEPSESTHVTIDLDTPTVTPTLQRREPKEEEFSEQDTITTPQVTECDAISCSSVSETTTPQLMSRSTPLVSHISHEISTPSVTPISEPPQPPDSPPQTTSEEVTPQQQQQQHTKEPILSESSTTSTTHLSSNKRSLTSSSSGSTDREISMGEYILKRRPIPFVLGNTSLSEGEVPLSPGDARWYSLYAAKMGKGRIHDWRQQPNRDTTVEAFLDLKNTPDPSSPSDSSQFSDSLQSESKVLSAGEVRKPKTKCSGADPFEKFLSKLNAITPDRSSTPTGLTENTLSEMSSLGADDPRLPKDPPPLSTTVTARASLQTKRSKSIPYHKKYPLKKTQHTSVFGQSSPGEVPRGLSPLHRSKARQKYVSSQNESVPQGTLSIGEVPVAILGQKGHAKNSVRNDTQVPVEPLTSSSLTETHTIKDDSVNELRDGIDVINVSRHSVKLIGSEHHTHTHSSQALSPQSESEPKRVQPMGEASRVLVVRPLTDEDLNINHKLLPKESPKHTVGVTAHQKLQVVDVPVEKEKGPVEDDLKISSLEISDSPPSSSLKEEHLLYTSPQMTVPPQSSPPRSPQRSPQPPPVITIPSAALTENSSSDSPVSEQLATDYTSDFDFSTISLPGN